MGVKTAQAIQKSNEWDTRIPIGVFYQNENVPTYQERIAARIPNYLDSPPAFQEIADGNGRPITNIDRLLGDLKVES
jgi:2-oxoglutarate ferredoxin oxidoreductase subunit beta